MTGDLYPDREAWPKHWRAIRTAAVWLLAISAIVGGGALLPPPNGLSLQIAMEVAIGLTAAVVAMFLACRVIAWWGRRRP